MVLYGPALSIPVRNLTHVTCSFFHPIDSRARQHAERRRQQGSAASGEAEAAPRQGLRFLRVSGGQPAERHGIYCSVACATISLGRTAAVTFRGLGRRHFEHPLES